MPFHTLPHALPSQVCEPRMISLISDVPLKCWEVVYELLLAESWSRDDPQRGLATLCERLREAIEADGDPAAHNQVGTALRMAADDG